MAKEETTLYSNTLRLKHERQKAFWKAFGIGFGPVLLASIVMSLLAILIIGDPEGFVRCFTGTEIGKTIAMFLTSILINCVLFLGIYFLRSKYKAVIREFSLILFIVITCYILTLLTVKFLNVYAMPILLVILLVAQLVDKRCGIYSTFILSMLLVMTYILAPHTSVSFTLSEAIAAVTANTIGAIITNFIVKEHLSRFQFIAQSVISSLLTIPFIIVSTIAVGDLTINILFNSLWSYGACLFAILLFLPLCAIFEALFNIADDFRLNELCNVNNPLLKRLASEAPGTFNHSLVVGNLAEACAEAIGENTQLARCGAYYHDIGKLKAPIYFSENQTDYNPHDELIPEVSVSMITSHTMFGERMAKQNKLPPEIVAICREHHGTSPVGYFYNKALNITEERDLGVDNFRYNGPKPQTKVSAIIMIADTCEAAMRAYSPENEDEYKARINKLIDEKLQLGQFDECPITMGEIATIKKTICVVLPSIHHTRVQYDNKKN